MNLRDLSGTIVAVAAAAGVIGGVVYSAGWVVSRAGAEEIMQQKANVVQQQIYEAQIDNERGRLESDIQILLLQINFMLSKPDRTEYDDLQLKIWKDSIALKQKRLAELEQVEAAQ